MHITDIDYHHPTKGESKYKQDGTISNGVQYDVEGEPHEYAPFDFELTNPMIWDYKREVYTPISNKNFIKLLKNDFIGSTLYTEFYNSQPVYTEEDHEASIANDKRNWR